MVLMWAYSESIKVEAMNIYSICVWLQIEICFNCFEKQNSCNLGSRLVIPVLFATLLKTFISINIFQGEDLRLWQWLYVTVHGLQTMCVCVFTVCENRKP